MSARLEILRGRLMHYYKAERAILTGQSYKIEGLELTRADLGTVIKMIGELEDSIRECEREEGYRAMRSRVRYVVPSDGRNMYSMRRVMSW